MKQAIQFAISVAALSGLLHAGVSVATPLAELPLKSSVLVKPNVIFALDNSGSMDWEVLLSNEEGKLRWDPTLKTFWDSANGRFLMTSSVEMSRLFATTFGASIDTMPAESVPPTPQFAAVRSSDYHGLYFNPATTYKHWSPSNNGTSTTNYADVSTANALAGTPSVLAPIAPGSSTTTDLLVTKTWEFVIPTGATIPAGVLVKSGATWGTVPTAADSVATAATTIRMSYYPATYWMREACTVDGIACVDAPEGGGPTLKRHEIKRVDYASDAAFLAEIQSFANWYTFYRKRYLMLNGAMGQVVEDLSGLRIGVVTFRGNAPATMYDLDATLATRNGLRVNGIFYAATPSGTTPTLSTYDYVARQFQRTDNDSLGNKIVQYACQRNNAFILTDGFYNGTGPTTPAYTQSTWGPGAPYTNIPSNSLADLALAYYTINPRSTLATGRVPEGAPGTNQDVNTNLHVNTYALTLNVNGDMWPTFGDPFVTAPTWPTPAVNTPSAIDDIWHATINGRGKMYTATTPENTKTQIADGLLHILSQTASQGGIAVSSINLAKGDGYAYLGVYNPSGWKGDLTKNAIDPNTAVISSTTTWSAATLLDAKDWTTRVIIGSNGTTGAAFNSANFGSFVNPGDAITPSANNPALIDYIRGNRAGEGSTWRKRSSRMGAVVNAKPVVSLADSTAFVASGEGMLHAIDTATGQERWAFVPYHDLAGIGQLTQRGVAYQTALDGSPALGKAGAQKILVAGMGAAGRGYYALDVTNPAAVTEGGAATTHLWTFPPAGDAGNAAKMGYTVGKPSIVKAYDNNYYVLVTSGYDNAQSFGQDGLGRMWMLNATTGSVVHTFVTSAGTVLAEAGLAHVSAYGEDDGTVRYVYGGDLLGNVWKFDLSAKTTTKLTTLTGPTGAAQPITAAPELANIKGNRVVIFGTGKLLDIGDFGNSQVQSVYAIADGAALASPRTTLRSQTFDPVTKTLTANTVDWTSNRGWYFDLPAGQQANTHPVVGFGNVAVVTNVTGATDCSASSYIYAISLEFGTVPVGTDTVQTLLSDKSNTSDPDVFRVAGTSGELIASGRLFDGDQWRFKMPDSKAAKARKNAWREIRK